MIIVDHHNFQISSNKRTSSENVTSVVCNNFSVQVIMLEKGVLTIVLLNLYPCNCKQLISCS